MDINFPSWDRIINKAFVPMRYNRDRYLILYGGRGSSKSDFAAKKLIYRCLKEPFFRYLLVRRVYATVKNSQYQNLKDLITEMGLGPLFRFKENPLEITCVNGNKFIAVGCDEVGKIKSIKDPTGAWYEEDIPDESDWTTITSSIRTQKAKYLQELFSINPEVEGAYEENWFWKRFFLGRAEPSFKGMTEVQVEKQKVQLTYTVHHSTWHDNRWISLEFKAFLENLRLTNPYYYTIYCLGLWGNKAIGSKAYKPFERAKHVTKLGYNPGAALHLSFDFNVRPYMTLTVWQTDLFDENAKEALQIDEVIGQDPHNRTKGVCELFRNRYPEHYGGVYIYGDPSGKQEDTRGEKGADDFAIIMKELKDYNPQKRVALSAPPVSQRIAWINEILAGGSTINLYFDPKCLYTIMDYSYGKEAADGTKHKERTKGEDGVYYEKYHHITDANDYFLCYLFKKEFSNYLRGHRKRDYSAGEAKSTFRR